MKLNVICKQKTDFHVLELFCRVCHCRASMHKITSLELLRTLNALFSATKQKKRKQGHRCWKASLSVRESWFMQFRSKTQVHERCLSHEMKCYCNAEDIFSCFRALLHITSLELELSEKLLSQWEKVGLCNFRSKTQMHERCFFLMKLNVLQCKDRFSCFRLFAEQIMLELQCTKSLV